MKQVRFVGLFVLLVVVSSTLAVRRSVCGLKVDPGPCKAYMPRFYFEIEKKECQEFIYGGCGGNENRFFTKRECQRICKLE